MNSNLLIRIFAIFCGLVVAVVMTGCGEIGDLGQEDGEAASPTVEEGGEDEETRSSAADEDDEAETSTSDDEADDEDGQAEAPEDDGAGDETEEPTSVPEDDGAGDETEEPAQEFADEGEETEESASDDSDEGDGDDPGAEATSESISGSGMTTSETVHLEGDYTVTFSVSGNTLMDVESNFIADLASADDDFDFHPLVNEIGTEVSGTTNVYGLDGDYYVDVMAEGDWSFEFTPQ